MPEETAAAGSGGSLWWRVWEKTWWAVAILFLALNAWAWNRYGVIALLRFWAAFFALLGAAVLVYARRMKQYAAESLHWLPVQAAVLRSEVVIDRQTSFNDESFGQARTTVYYHPEIEYEYEVEGRRYRSNRLIAARVNFPKSAAESWVANYPAGSVVTARRHPQKPELAVLQPGIQGFEGQYRIPFIVGGVFLAVGAVAWIVLS